MKRFVSHLLAHHPVFKAVGHVHPWRIRLSRSVWVKRRSRRAPWELPSARPSTKQNSGLSSRMRPAVVRITASRLWGCAPGRWCGPAARTARRTRRRAAFLPQQQGHLVQQLAGQVPHPEWPPPPRGCLGLLQPLGRRAHLFLPAQRLHGAVGQRTAPRRAFSRPAFAYRSRIGTSHALAFSASSSCRASSGRISAPKPRGRKGRARATGQPKAARCRRSFPVRTAAPPAALSGRSWPPPAASRRKARGAPGPAAPYQPDGGRVLGGSGLVEEKTGCPPAGTHTAAAQGTPRSRQITAIFHRQPPAAPAGQWPRPPAASPARVSAWLRVLGRAGPRPARGCRPPAAAPGAQGPARRCAASRWSAPQAKPPPPVLAGRSAARPAPFFCAAEKPQPPLRRPARRSKKRHGGLGGKLQNALQQTALGRVEGVELVNEHGPALKSPAPAPQRRSAPGPRVHGRPQSAS